MSCRFGKIVQLIPISNHMLHVALFHPNPPLWSQGTGAIDPALYPKAIAVITAELAFIARGTILEAVHSAAVGPSVVPLPGVAVAIAVFDVAQAVRTAHT